MSFRKAKTAPKIFVSDKNTLRHKVTSTMNRISDIVGSSLGPGGRITMIESDFPGIPNKLTKDGVTIFKSLGANDSFEHLIIESTRDVAQRTASEAGDGTTTATVLSNSIIHKLFAFCDANPKYSPQKATRILSKYVESVLIPYINGRTLLIGEENKDLLRMVAKISANGDDDMAAAVIEAFEVIGYGDASHVTIKELSGKKAYKVDRIDGFPIPMGYEESVGKFHPAFINDQGNQRCALENPLYVLFDGNIHDLISFMPIFDALAIKYRDEGSSDYKNVVLMAHGFSESVLTTLAFSFSDPNSLNILPVVTPMSQFLNSQLNFLMDVSAFTGAKIFGMKIPIATATLEDLGTGAESFECYRFRSTIVGNPDELNVTVRADQLRAQLQSPESEAETINLNERLGKITNGIARLTIYGGSNGELKEAHDRVEDAVCSVRSAITHGAIPGGCRIAIDMALKLMEELEEGNPAREVLAPALMALPKKLLDNAGYSEEEVKEIIGKLADSPELVYDVENQLFGKAEELGLFDATKAVSESLSNAVSIASVLGTIGGMVAHPRDATFERSEARADTDFGRATDSPESFKNESNDRW